VPFLALFGPIIKFYARLEDIPAPELDKLSNIEIGALSDGLGNVAQRTKERRNVIPKIK